MPKRQHHNPHHPFPRLPLPVVLVLPGYRAPSLNRTLGQHWTVLHREKLKASRALLAALASASSSPSDSTESDRLTSTMPADR